jgi:hypothetical protein
VDWYQDNVVGGTSAFLTITNDIDDFDRAVRAKIGRAIGRETSRQTHLEVPEPSTLALLALGFTGQAGGGGWQALRSFGSSLRAMRSRKTSTPTPTPTSAAAFQDRMAQAWRDFPGPILLLLSERDLTAQEFAESAATHPAWRGWERKPQLQKQILPAADHTCSTPDTSQQVQDSVLRYLAGLR